MSVPSLRTADPVWAVLGTALDGLALRQQVAADNVANVDTPDFRATSVDFESSLRRAVETGDPTGVRARMEATDTPVGPNGNNVDLRKELLTMSQTQFQYQLLTRAVGDRFALLRMAAGG